MRLLRSGLSAAYLSSTRIAPKEQSRSEAPERLALLEKQYRYPGNQTCAGDGLCSMSCPMGFSTGDLTHIIRQKKFAARQHGI